MTVIILAGRSVLFETDWPNQARSERKRLIAVCLAIVESVWVAGAMLLGIAPARPIPLFSVKYGKLED